VAESGADGIRSAAAEGGTAPPRRRLIVNADDFGASTGINRGIVECHEHGIVTSTSLMVTGRAAKEAAVLSRECPNLSLGLHWDVWGEDEREFSVEDEQAVRLEFARQLEAFRDLVGRDPTHVDSHKHAHRDGNGRPLAVFRELVEPLGVPLRGDGGVRFVGEFYAQWQWRVSDLRLVSVEALLALLAEEVAPGWTELACHPGYRSDDFDSVYLSEREVELRTLTDARVRAAVDDLEIRLASYGDYCTVGPP
jgi:predicted glycoside hydrolase/deacetylase ChbG (UPF0249 family)